MTNQPLILDERDIAVADRSYRLAYVVLVFGTLFDMLGRQVLWNQPCWDLLGLVCVSAWMARFYQHKKQVQVLPRGGWTRKMILISMAVGIAVSLLLMTVMTTLRIAPQQSGRAWGIAGLVVAVSGVLVGLWQYRAKRQRR